MIARNLCLAAASSLALLAAPAPLEKSKANPDGMGSPVMDPRGYQLFDLLVEVHIGWTLKEPGKSLTIASVSRNRMAVYEAEFGDGYLDLDFASLGAGGRAELHSLHMRY